MSMNNSNTWGTAITNNNNNNNNNNNINNNNNENNKTINLMYICRVKLK